MLTIHLPLTYAQATSLMSGLAVLVGLEYGWAIYRTVKGLRRNR